MKAEAKSLRFLGEGKKLSVPFFQRRYVWSQSNWQELLENFENQDVIPFLGSIILKDEGKSNSTIIDGQQRLTTVTILAKAIYDCLPDSSKQPGSGIRNCIENFLFYRKNAADDFIDSCIKIEHSKNDHADYDLVIASQTLNSNKIDLDTINENSSCVLKCYKYYCEKLGTKTDKELRILFSSLFEEDRRVLVVIELETGDINEQTIFDTINRAGVRLSTADIVKNNLYKHLLAKCGDDNDKKEQVYTTYKNCWEEVFNKSQELSDIWDEERVFGNVKHNNLEFLLYCIACIKWGEDCDMFANLAVVFEREVTHLGFAELLSLANEIKEYALIFKKYILDFKSDLEDDQKNTYIKYDDHVARLLLILQKFKVQMFYPYVIMRLHDVNQDDANTVLQDDFKKLESFIVRRKISPRGTHDYTSKCYQIIHKGIDSLGDSDFGNPDGKISDYEVKQYLGNTKDDAAKMILFCIELYRRRAAAVDVKALEYAYTLEHIMPKKWERNWSNIDINNNGTVLEPTSAEGKQFRDAMIQSLGNKTLLTSSLNSSVKNAAFIKKIAGDGEHKPGYKAHTTLFVTREIVEAAEKDPVWDEQHIIKRLDNLYAEFVILWPSYYVPSAKLEGNDDEDPIIAHYTEEQLADPLALLSAVPCTVTEEGQNQENIAVDEMITLEEFETLVSAQPETIERYVREGKIVADATALVSDHRDRKYFKLESVKSYVEQFGWVIIDDANRKQLFMDMVQQMDMSYSYKPVFLKAVLKYADNEGSVKLDRVVSYFLNYYKNRRNAGVTVEKDNSVFVNPACSEVDAEKIILKYPYDRFRTMQVLTLEAEGTEIHFNKNLWDQLTFEEKMEIEDICDQKLIAYFSRF